MDELVARLVANVGVDRTAAEKSVGIILDFLRIIDVRYAGLTPGQWSAIAMFAFGLTVMVYAKRRAALVDALLAPLDEPAPTT